MRAAETPCDVDAHGDPETPTPCDRVVVTGGARGSGQRSAAGDNLGHHPAPEENQQHRPEELGGAFAE